MVGIPTQSAYNAAKFAVRGFSEVPPGGVPMNSNLFVSSVHPGGVQTNIARSARTDGDSSMADADERDQQFRRLGPNDTSARGGHHPARHCPR